MYETAMLSGTHEDLCVLWPLPLPTYDLDSPGTGGHREPSPSPARGLQSETFIHPQSQGVWSFSEGV